MRRIHSICVKLYTRVTLRVCHGHDRSVGQDAERSGERRKHRNRNRNRFDPASSYKCCCRLKKVGGVYKCKVGGEREGGW